MTPRHRARALTSALLASLLSACGGSQTASTAPPPSAEVDPHDVRLPADASVGDFIAALKRALAAGGHEGGECFVAWGLPVEDGTEQIDVHIGDRERSAAVSCDGFDGLGPGMEGRCPFVRYFWVEGSEMRTAALTFWFAPAGRAYANRAIGGSPITTPAAEAVFREGPEGTQLVLGIPLHPPPEQSAGKKQDGASGGMAAAPENNPMSDPVIMRALQQLVSRVQTCNPSGEGSLVLEWAVAPDGSIAGVRPLTSSVDPDVVECALGVLREASFPEHQGPQPIDYCVPVMLAPSLRPDGSAPPPGASGQENDAPATGEHTDPAAQETEAPAASE